MTDLAKEIENIWERRDQLTTGESEVNSVIHEAINLLDTGKERVAEYDNENGVQVNEWLKLAILLLFRQSEMSIQEVGPFEFVEKIHLKKNYYESKLRVVHGASARWGSYQAPGVVMLPSYINIGAYVGENTMVDTWATVGSCAQIGKNVHLSGGVGIGGVLEPPNAVPVFIGDECLIGSRCIVAEGASVGEGSVLGAGAVLTGSIPVIDAESGNELSRGIVPPWCVAVQASRERQFTGGTFGLPCVLVVRYLEPGERHDKSTLNEVLRTHGVTT